MIKCLLDLFSSKNNTYLEVIKREVHLFDILKNYLEIQFCQLKYLQNIMSVFNNFTREHISIDIISLNVMSLFLYDEAFDFDYLY